jgi:hypothetical protein
MRMPFFSRPSAIDACAVAEYMILLKAVVHANGLDYRVRHFIVLINFQSVMYSLDRAPCR